MEFLGNYDTKTNQLVLTPKQLNLFHPSKGWLVKGNFPQKRSKNISKLPRKQLRDNFCSHIIYLDHGWISRLNKNQSKLKFDTEDQVFFKVTFLLGKIGLW